MLKSIWVALRVVLIVLALGFLALLAFAVFYNRKFGTIDIVLFVFLFAGDTALVYLLWPNKRKNNNRERGFNEPTISPSDSDPLRFTQGERKARDTIHLSDAQLLGIERGELPTIVENEAVLHAGENAVYSAAAVLLITKKRAVGRKNAGAGISFRVARGVSVHTGGGESQTVFGDVTERYSGRVLVTTERIIFLQGQKGFEQKLEYLTALTPYSDGVGLQFGNTTYTLATTAPRFILQTVQRVRNL